MLQTKWMHGAVKYLFSNVGEVCKVCEVVFLGLGVIMRQWLILGE